MLIVVSAVAAIASLLTFYSGFGLGTVLMPAFSIFFPVEIAVALTAVVHFLNNLFKLALTGRHAKMQVIGRFGLPALVAAPLGAWALQALSGLPSLFQYTLFHRTMHVLPVKITIAMLILIFALWELLPRFSAMAMDPKFLPLGGLASGFFGGLSGNQGALRSAFLLRCGLTKEAYIATGVVIACLVDVSRIAVYATHTPWHLLSEHGVLLAVATASAFAGAWIGNRLLRKTTLRGVQILVSVMLLAIAAGLVAGLL